MFVFTIEKRSKIYHNKTKIKRKTTQTHLILYLGEGNISGIFFWVINFIWLMLPNNIAHQNHNPSATK